MSHATWKKASTATHGEGGRVRNLLLELLTAPEEERQALELALLEDDALFEELERAEDELIDAAISGSLEPASRQLLDELLATSPRLRERLATAYQLRQRALEHQARNRWRRERVWLAAAAVGVTAVGLAFFVTGGLESPETGGPPPPQIAEGPVPDGGEATANSHPPLFLALIAPRGSAQVPTVIRPPSEEVLPLHVEVAEEPYGTFRLALLDQAERMRVSWQGLEPETREGRRVVVVEVPWSQLGPGRSLLVLAGEENGSATELAYHELEVATPGEP